MVELHRDDVSWEELSLPWNEWTAPWDGTAEDYDRINVQIQVSTTDDDPAGSPVWTDWRTFVVSDITARAWRFRLKLSSEDSSLTPVVRSISVAIDMPDRWISGADIDVTGSATIAFASPLHSLKALQVALSNLESGDRYEITGKGPGGFTITIYDSAGAVSTHTAQLDYQALGYGVEAA